MGSDNKELEYDKKTGLPKMDQDERDKGESGGMKATLITPFFFTAIGLGIGYATYKFGSTEVYDAKIDQVVSHGMVYGYLSAWVFARLV